MATDTLYPLLMQIDSPADLRNLNQDDLPELASEMRQYLIDSLDHCGGHFGANLGSIELTIALHYLFNTPDDKLIWDVGHQAYPHKMLTGRRDQLRTIKQPNGLAPFPKRGESPYDCFGTGHSSTSISAAVGMAMAAQRQDRDQKTIAVIGDGGFTGGMAFEALNHVGAEDCDVLVVLNDNEMSISENVGALTQYFAKITAGPTYANLRESSKRFLSKLPNIKKFAKITESHMKGLVQPAPGTIFEALGFNYYGPIDGHDVHALVRSLSALKDSKSPRILHIVTTKGKGYSPAEDDPIKYHAVSPGFHNKVENTAKPASTPTYSDLFGDWLCDQAKDDKKLMAITPAMREGSGMVRFSREYPEQYFDVAIAEQHSVTFAAGMACEGLKPVVAIYSTFLQRGYDQLIHDVCLQDLDVTFGIDRAGLVGSDGPTHSGRFDLSYLRCLPNMVVIAPSDGKECRDALHTAYLHKGPAAVRYPRGAATNPPTDDNMTALPLGKAEVKRQGKNIAILAFGSMVAPALEAGAALDATVINMRFVKPLDTQLINELAKTHDHFITVEENTVLGGAGSAVSEYCAAAGIQIKMTHLGLPDRFIDHGKPAQMLANVGLDANGIIASINKVREAVH